MGVSFGVLAYGNGERVDVLRPPTDADPLTAAAIINPRSTFRRTIDVDLINGGRPARGDMNIAAYDDGWLIATHDAMKFDPTQLPDRYLKPALGRHVVLMMQQSVYDVFAYGRWRDGQLVRWLCINPSGVHRSSGVPESWELPLWRGEYATDDPAAALPFHPLDFGDVAAQTILGVLGESVALTEHVRSIDEVMLTSYVKA